LKITNFCAILATILTIQHTIDIPADRRVVFDLPREVPDGKITLTLSVETVEETPLKIIPPEQIKTLLRDDDSVYGRYSNRPQDIRETRIAIAFRAGKSHDDQSYAKYAGCLKDSGIFSGDSVSIQKEMRRDWT
jgi:hypothetical protein